MRNISALKNQILDRIQKAKDSIRLMKAFYDNENSFFDQFELFLVRSRGLIDYFENQYGFRIGKKKNYPLWYAKKIKSFHNKPLNKFFNDLRNLDVHEIPNQIINKFICPDGSYQERCGVDYVGYTPVTKGNFNPNTAILNKRFLSKYPKKEVIQCCKSYLNSVINFINDCKRVLGVP